MVTLPTTEQASIGGTEYSLTEQDTQGIMTKPKIFIDGESGTTGLQIYSRLNQRDDIELVSIETSRRKDSNERAKLVNAVDIAILCLPDDAAREAVSFVSSTTVKILDASSVHRTAQGWVYGFRDVLLHLPDREV